MGGLNKIGISLTIIFVISLVLLLAELFYVLWRRRVFHRHAPRQATTQGRASVDSTSQDGLAFSETSISFSSYSKELMYFYFCMNSSGISRVVQPNSAPPSLSSGGSCPDGEMVEVVDEFKLQNMYGPPRFLFTIKEEEKENDAEYHSDREKRVNTDKEDSKRSVKLDECFKAAGDELSAVTVLQVEEEGGVPEGNDHHVITMDGESDNSTPPFSTPTGSPVYFTPSASPNHTHGMQH